MDGRKSCTEIAKEVGVKKEVVYKNFREMKQAGIIKGATIHINYRGFGYKAVALLLINVDPLQTDALIVYAQKMQDIYAVYKQGPGGNVRIVATLRTLRQLDEIKDTIKQQFSILSLKTVIWTDVREMHENLTLAPQKTTNTSKEANLTVRKATIDAVQKENIKLDEVDLKTSDALAENGRVPLSVVAHKIGISTDSASKRYQKLRKNGLIKVTTQIDPKKIGYRALAIFYTMFTLQADSSTIIEKMSRIPDIISIMKTSGDYDLQIYVMIRDLDQLLAVQNKFAKIQGIAKMDLDISESPSKWPTPRQYISTF